MEFIDIAIIGPLPLGLATITEVAREHYSVVFFDKYIYGDGDSSAMDMVPMWDHEDSRESREADREELLARYPNVRFAHVGVVDIVKMSGFDFYVLDEDGEWYKFRKIIIGFDLGPPLPRYVRQPNVSHNSANVSVIPSLSAKGSLLHSSHNLLCSGYDSLFVVPPVGHGM